MDISKLRHSAGRALRNIRRGRLEGVGHDFVADVRIRLPQIKIRTIFDIGAHIGMTALEFSDTWPNATVHAFEPHPGNFRRMKANLIGKPEVRIHNIGLGDAAGSMPFHFDPAHPSMARITSHGEEITDTITVKTVDEFCGDYEVSQIDFMKIDVEGHELSVLAGSRKMLRSGRISLMKIETAVDPDSHYHTQLFDLTEYLHPFGYRLFGFYDQWEFPPEPNNARLRRFDVAFIANGRWHR